MTLTGGVGKQGQRMATAMAACRSAAAVATGSRLIEGALKTNSGFVAVNEDPRCVMHGCLAAARTKAPN